MSKNQPIMSSYWCSGLSWNFSCTCAVSVLLLKAGATVNHHLLLEGAILSLSPPRPLSAYLINSLSPFSPPWQVSSSTAASLKTTRSDSRETGESWLHNKDLLWWWNVLQGPKHPLREISPSDNSRLTLAPEPWGWGMRRRDPNLIGSAAWGGSGVTKSNSRQAAVMHN